MFGQSLLRNYFFVLKVVNVGRVFPFNHLSIVSTYYDCVSKLKIAQYHLK